MVQAYSEDDFINGRCFCGAPGTFIHIVIASKRDAFVFIKCCECAAQEPNTDGMRVPIANVLQFLQSVEGLKNV